MGGRSLGVASVGSCQEPPPCPAEPVPDSSRMDVLLAKAKPFSHRGKASVITYLRRKQKGYCADVIAAREEWSENM